MGPHWHAHRLRLGARRVRRHRCTHMNVNVKGRANMDMALDYVTIGARSLDEGAAYIREVLGVDIPAGGKHPDMGTHNRLMRVGDGVFLELLAIDGDAPRPPPPRWSA